MAMVRRGESVFNLEIIEGLHSQCTTTNIGVHRNQHEQLLLHSSISGPTQQRDHSMRVAPNGFAYRPAANVNPYFVPGKYYRFLFEYNGLFKISLIF